MVIELIVLVSIDRNWALPEEILEADINPVLRDLVVKSSALVEEYIKKRVDILEILEVLRLTKPVTVDRGWPTFVESVEIPVLLIRESRLVATERFERPVDKPLRTSKREFPIATERFEKANPVAVEKVESPERTSRKFVLVVTERFEIAVLRLLCKFRFNKYKTEAEVLERTASLVTKR